MKSIPLPKLNRTSISVIVAILVIAILAAIIFAVVSSQTQAPSNTATVRRGDISATVNATGKVRAKRSARLAVPMSGVVQSIVKMEGDAVNLGDVILSLRADETTRRVRQAELNLQSRQLDLARGKSSPRDEDIEIARASLRKATMAVAAAESSYNTNPSAQNDAAREIARADLDIARANFNRVTNGLSKEEIEALQNAVVYAQLDLESAKTALAQTKLTAPFTSTVTEITVREGELVGGFTPLAAVADLNALEIAVEIDEIDVANVKVGQKVEVRLDAFPGERFSGILTRLFPAASSQRGSTVYAAVVEFDRKNFDVRLGMGANLKILTVEKKGTLLVPNRALKNVGTRKAVQISAPGAARDVIVEIGVTDGNETEIISGVNEGDQVFVNQ
ncbi:MAG: efflux RND transporter periplasmic adaptor subunit [Anaerolineales bacterium]|nr:efflux RND transporter periplasmic adaptor subunit [Anaerolineales bacterium]